MNPTFQLNNDYSNWAEFKDYILSLNQFALLDNKVNDLSSLKKLSVVAEQKIKEQYYDLFFDYKSPLFKIFDFYTHHDKSVILDLWDAKPIVLTYEVPKPEYTSEKFIYVIAHPEIVNEIRTHKKENLKAVSLPIQDEVMNLPEESHTPNPQQIEDTNKNNPIKYDPSTNIVSMTEKLNEQLWSQMRNQHDNFSVIALKKFDAYMVLRVTKDLYTEVYKMDEDLEKEIINKIIFKYSLKEENNPFYKVYHSQMSESFKMEDFNQQVLDFKYACVTSLKLGPKVVGFIVGFKASALSQDDITTLESLSEKAI